MAGKRSTRKEYKLDTIKELRNQVCKAFYITTGDEFKIYSSKYAYYYIKLREITGLSEGTIYKFFRNDSNLNYESFTMQQIEVFIKKALNDKTLIEGLNKQRNNEEKSSNEIVEINIERNIKKFIKILGVSENSRYSKINELFVPPKEYDEIKETLKKEKIVFISGLPEYGKTFTAINLLWEWYKNEYDVIWEKGNDETEREKVRKSLGTSIENLLSKTIYYFEDPFGKSKYENQSGELEIKISQVLRYIASLEDTYVIITSREDIFKEFKKLSLSNDILNNIEKKLTHSSPSYNLNQRIELLLNYGKLYNCKWLNDAILKKFILNKIKNSKILSTPLTIYNFSYSSKNDVTIKNINLNIEIESKEIGRRFAYEVKSMNDEEKLFFTVQFIVRTLDILIFYLEIFKGKDEGVLAKIINKYENVKIERYEIKEDYFEITSYILLHSSYYYAWEYLKKESDFIKIANNVIINSKYGEFELWFKNYSILTSDTKEKLFNFSKDPNKALNLAYNIIEFHDKIPKEIYEILTTCVQTGEEDINYSHYNKDEIMYKIMRKWNIFPKNIRNLIANYGGDRCGKYIIENWDTFSNSNAQDYFFSIVKNNRAKEETLEKILLNYNLLPINVINTIPSIIQYVDFDDCVYIFNKTCEKNSLKKFPINKEKFFLLKLSTQNDYLFCKTLLKIDNSNYLPNKVKKALLYNKNTNQRIYKYLLSYISKSTEEIKESTFYLFNDTIKYLNSNQIKRIRNEIILLGGSGHSPTR